MGFNMLYFNKTNFEWYRDVKYQFNFCIVILLYYCTIERAPYLNVLSYVDGFVDDDDDDDDDEKDIEDSPNPKPTPDDEIKDEC